MNDKTEEAVVETTEDNVVEEQVTTEETTEQPVDETPAVIYGFDRIGKILAAEANLTGDGEIDYNIVSAKKLSDSLEFIKYFESMDISNDKEAMLSTDLTNEQASDIIEHVANNLHSLMNLTATLAGQAPKDDESDIDFNPYLNAGEVFEMNYGQWQELLGDNLVQLEATENLPKDRACLYAVYTMANRMIRSTELDAQLSSLVVILVYLEKHNIATIQEIIEAV